MPDNREWLRQLAVAWQAIVVCAPREQVVRAWIEGLMMPGLIGTDLSSIELAPRAGVGAVYEWNVALPLTGELTPAHLERALRAHPPRFVQLTIRMVPNATLSDINCLAAAIARLLPEDAHAVWTAPFPDGVAPSNRMELALLAIEEV